MENENENEKMSFYINTGKEYMSTKMKISPMSFELKELRDMPFNPNLLSDSQKSYFNAENPIYKEISREDLVKTTTKNLEIIESCKDERWVTEFEKRVLKMKNPQIPKSVLSKIRKLNAI